MSSLPAPAPRNLIFHENFTNESVSKLSNSILSINDSDRYLEKFYALHGLKYTPKEIVINVDSYGGQVYQSLGLLSIISNSITPVHTIVTGCAMSSGFMLAISGHKRSAHKNSSLMYHQLSAGAIGEMKTIEEKTLEYKRLQKILEKIVLEKTNISKKQLKEIRNTKTDWYMSPEEALKLGVIDEIL